MNIQEKSYIFGLLITDGNLYLQNTKGKVSLELNEKDKDIVEKLYSIIPNSNISNRIRSTNFKDNYESITFVNCRKEFRNWLIDFGYPTKDKTNLASIPTKEYSERDFWRGVIDGDGSLGFIADGSPFISLVTKSENLKKHYCTLLKNQLDIDKNINRNKRDGVYNIVIKNEDAILLAKYLYENSTLYLNRKYDKYNEILQWKRTKKKIIAKSWKQEEIDFILNHSLEESIKELGRSKSSIQNKKYKVTK